MGLIRLSVRRPVTTTVIVLMAVLLGLFSYTRLGVTLLPKVDIPVVLVRVDYSGAGPQEIERLVNKPVEDAVSTVEGVEKIRSYAIEGTGFTVAELSYETDISQAALDISTRIRAIQGRLPDDAEDPVVEKYDIASSPFMTLVVTSPLPSNQVRDIADDQIVRRLTQLKGMAQVDLLGGRTREIHLDADPLRLKAHGLSLRQLSSLVMRSNLNSPSGSITLKDKETSVRVVGEPGNPADIESIGIPVGNNRFIQLGDVVKVEDGLAKERNRARYNGRDSVLLDLKARPNANIVNLAKQVRADLEGIRPGLPRDMDIEVVFDSSTFVANSVRNVIRDMILGTILTALILYLFLQRFGATVAVAVAMPSSVIATFIAMAGAGFTLNVMSTLGLATTLGILVNNSILVLENIYRFLDSGKDPETAAIEGTGEIAVSVLATTLTNLAVFIPVAFMGGIVGQFFRQFALTVVFSTLFSLWVAFSFTPMTTAYLAKRGQGVSRFARISTGWFQRLYNSLDDLHDVLVKASVRHPFMTIGLFALLFAGALALYPRLGFEFFSRVDEGIVSVNLDLSSTASLNATDEQVRKVEAALSRNPYVNSVSATVGSGSGLSGINSATVNAYLVESGKRPSAFELASRWRQDFAGLPDVNLTVDVASRRGGTRGKPVSISIAGADLDELNRIASEVMREMRKIPGLVDVDTDWKVGREELRLTPRQNRLTTLGITLDDVAGELRGTLNGIKTGVYREGGYEYDILVRLSPEWVENPARVAQIPLYTPRGFVPLNQVVVVENTRGPTAINRLDRQRTVTVEADVAGRTVGEAFNELNPRLKEITLPPGYRLIYGGEIESIQENFRRLILALGIASILTFLIIAAIIESYLFSVIVMLTVPLSVIGVFPALLLTNTPITIYGLLGLVELVGLVVNNAIVVLDYAETLRRSGTAAAEAVVEACRVRLRPIIMADMTTVIAMVPLALGLGEGGQYRAPLAIVLIGGLIAGGFFALFLIPAVYRVVWDARDWFFIGRRRNA